MMRSTILIVFLLGLCHSLAAKPDSFGNGDSDEMNRIRNMLFRNVTKDLPEPQLCFLLGGIGSGKSTALRDYIATLGLITPVDRVHLGYNHILTHLDGWDVSDRCTASRLSNHCKELQEMFFEEAVRSRTNVLFEGPIHDADLVKSMVDFALARNYVVNVVGAALDTRTAVTRALQQMRANSHWISLHEVVRSHIGFAEAFPSLIQPNQINCTLLYDTTVPNHPALILKDSNILMPQKFADFMSEATVQEDEIRASLNDDEVDTFHSLCDCREVSDADETMCGSKKDKEHDANKSRKRWRAAAIGFILLSALLLLGLVVMSLRYGQLKRQGYSEEVPRYGYDPQPRRSPPAVAGYSKIEENA